MTREEIVNEIFKREEEIGWRKAEIEELVWEIEEFNLILDNLKNEEQS